MRYRGAGYIGRFALREGVRFCALMVAVSMVTFALVAASPIDPVQANVGQQALLGMSAAKRAQLAEHWGASTPLPERYLMWARGVLAGDWGMSLRYNAPVVQVVGRAPRQLHRALGVRMDAGRRYRHGTGRRRGNPSR